MKCSLDTSNFLEKISRLSESFVFLYFFSLSILMKAFLFLLAILWNSTFSWVYLSFSSLLFSFLLSAAICKASSNNYFAFLHFSPFWDGFSHCLLFNIISLCPVLCLSPAPLSMRFSRQEYWSRLPCPLLGHLSIPRTEPLSLMSPALAGRFFTTSITWETLIIV